MRIDVKMCSSEIVIIQTVFITFDRHIMKMDLIMYCLMRKIAEIFIFAHNLKHGTLNNQATLLRTLKQDIFDY